MIIPVPAPMGGAIVLGESVIAYMGHGQQMKCTEITPTIIRVRHLCMAALQHGCLHSQHAPVCMAPLHQNTMDSQCLDRGRSSRAVDLLHTTCNQVVHLMRHVALPGLMDC